MKKSLAAVSAMTMVVLYGILAGVVALICLLSDVPASGAMLVGVAVLIVQFIISPWLTDLNMKWFYKADFKAEIPPYLKQFIQNVCDEKNMKYPRVAVIADGAPNAFTYGHTKNDARVVLTAGIFDLLSEDEVCAVTAHELGHAVHYDMLLMTAAQIVPMLLYAIYDVCRRVNLSNRSSDSKDDNKSRAAIAAIQLIAYLAYIICQYIILWFSRTREYYADEFAARQTGKPASLASALVQIGFGLSTRRSSAAEAGKKHSAASPSTLGISDTKTSTGLAVCCYDNGELSREYVKDAMKWDLWNVWAKLYELSSTHPLISKRLIALGRISDELGQAPYVNFDCEKPESYLDDFLRELLLIFMPWMFLIGGAVACMILVAVPATVNTGMMIMAACLVLTAAASLLKHRYRHQKTYEQRTVRSLLGEVKVSGITGIPCELDGYIIGRGNPGCIFNEDFVLQDSTGIILLDYNQPLTFINKLFAIFHSEEYFSKSVHIRGWYFRKPVPYIELLSFEVDGKVKKCHTVTTGYVLRFILLAAALAFLVFSVAAAL